MVIIDATYSKKHDIVRTLRFDKNLENILFILLDGEKKRDTEWENYLLPAMRENKYPKTNNEIERFFKQFERFYKTRKGFTSVASATQQLMVFMVMYLFTIQAKSGQAPIEKNVPEAKRMPLYQILNNPIRWMPANLSRKSAEALETRAMAEIEHKKAS